MRGIVLVAALALAEVALAQTPTLPPTANPFTPPQPTQPFAQACARDGDTDCVNVIGITADKNGCTPPFLNYNEKTKSCEGLVTYQERFTCGTAVQGPQGWTMTCSVAPRPSAKTPANTPAQTPKEKK